MSVTPADLTGTERNVLLVLMAQCRPVPNPELVDLGPRLDRDGRDKLNRLGLIESEIVDRRYVHELTDRGWRLCRDILTAGAPAKSGGPVKALYTLLAAFDSYLTGADLSLADVFSAKSAPSSTAERVRATYSALAARPGAWVGLARLRAELEAPDLDATLAQLYRTGAVSLIPEENQKVLTPDDRDAAIVIGGQAKHLIAIEV